MPSGAFDLLLTYRKSDDSVWILADDVLTFLTAGSISLDNIGEPEAAAAAAALTDLIGRCVASYRDKLAVASVADATEAALSA